MKSVNSGGCQCGAVRYEAYGKPLSVSLCHCRMCQKALGGPFGVYAMFRDMEFSWTRGTPGTFRSSSLAIRDHCATCGKALTFRYGDEAKVFVNVGTLDEPYDVRPRLQKGIESRLSWVYAEVLDSLPEQETPALPGATKRRQITSYQHPDHNTAAPWRPRSEG